MRFHELTEEYVEGNGAIAGLWIEPGMSPKVISVIRRMAPMIMADISKRNWEMACQSTARLWQKALEKSGISSRYTDGRFVVDPKLYDSGDFDDDILDDLATVHAWLTIDGKIFDPTAGQFSWPSRIWPIDLKSIKNSMYIEE